MKKVLSILLVVALVATLFAGCGGDPTGTPGASVDPSASVEPSAVPTTAAPTADPKIAWKSNWNEGDALVEINVYDTVNYLAEWQAYSRYLLSQHGLKLGAAIAPVLSDQISIGKYELIKTEQGRATYASAIANLFLDAATTPDFMPALYATNTVQGAVFKESSLGPNFLIDLAPHIEEGGALHDYITWVWETMGDINYWNKAKESLKTADGAIYALPRLEYTPIKRLIHFNWSAFVEMGREMPTTLGELEDALAAWVADGHNGFMFNQEWITIDSIIQPIANAYGIEFNSGFNWKEMNGEPMFSYYFPEYLKVLETVNKWAANGWVLESSEVAGHIAMCTDLATDAKLAGGWGDAWNYLNNALMLYGEVWHGYGLQCADYGWQDQAISAEGYTAAISGESAFDYCYLAITNRQVTSEDEAGYDVPLRIMSYWNSTCNEEAYILASHGQIGVPFAPTFEESGVMIWVEHDDGNKYLRGSSLADRFDMRDADESKPLWQSGKKLFRQVHPLYTWVFDVCNGFQSGDWVPRAQWGFNLTADDLVLDEETWNFNEAYDITKDEWVVPGASQRDEVPADKSEWQYYAELASKPVEEGGYGITDFWYDYSEDDRLWVLRGSHSGGMDMFADVSAFPMGYTIYRFNESQHKCYPRLEQMEAWGAEQGTIIYNGFFPGVTEVLSGKEAAEMNTKINNLSSIAKSFTIDYLSGKKTNADWNAYIKSLEDNGIKEVYEFYAATATVFMTEHKEGVYSMSALID